jgi:hypothetical protein
LTSTFEKTIRVSDIGKLWKVNYIKYIWESIAKCLCGFIRHVTTDGLRLQVIDKIIKIFTGFPCGGRGD